MISSGLFKLSHADIVKGHLSNPYSLFHMRANAKEFSLTDLARKLGRATPRLD